MFGRRRLLLAGVGIGVASAAALVLAIVVIVSSVVSDDLGLPSDGSLADILEEDSPSGNGGVVSTDELEFVSVPQGPLPIRVDIGGIFIDAPVITLGIGADTIPEVPQRPDQIAWYNFSATPGQNNNAVFSGHVDWQTARGDPIPGVFYRLREVHIGDTITVTLENDEVLEYRVTGNVATAYDDPTKRQGGGNAARGDLCRPGAMGTTLGGPLPPVGTDGDPGARGRRRARRHGRAVDGADERSAPAIRDVPPVADRP